jgi:hypothetical protein
MKSMLSLRMRTQSGVTAPQRGETFGTLDRPVGEAERDAAAGRVHQFNMRVADWVRKKVRRLAKAERATLGEVMEAMIEAYEARGGNLEVGAVSVEDQRAGRRHEIRFYATEAVYRALPKVSAERGMTVSALLDELLALEVHRLDPHGGKFGVRVERG